MAIREVPYSGASLGEITLENLSDQDILRYNSLSGKWENKALNIESGITNSLITFFEQLGNFINNATVTEADYDVTLNSMRTDV